MWSLPEQDQGSGWAKAKKRLGFSAKFSSRMGHSDNHQRLLSRNIQQIQYRVTAPIESGLDAAEEG
jgi:hypothetical protein